MTPARAQERDLPPDETPKPKRQRLRRVLVAVGLAARPTDSQTPEGQAGDEVIRKRTKVVAQGSKWTAIVVALSQAASPFLAEFKAWRAEEAKRGDTQAELLRTLTRSVEAQTASTEKLGERFDDLTLGIGVAIGTTRLPKERRVSATPAKAVAVKPAQPTMRPDP